MLCTIRVIDPAFKPMTKAAEVGAREIASVRDYLRQNDPFAQNHELSKMQDNIHDFTASVSHHSLASIAKRFNMRPAMIAVIEEANFARLRIRFYKTRMNAGFTAIVSNVVDQCEPVPVPHRAIKLIQGLSGEPPSQTGQIQISRLAPIVSHPEIYRTMVSVGLERTLPAFRYIAASHLMHPSAVMAW